MKYPTEWNGRVRCDGFGDVYLDGVLLGRVRPKDGNAPYLQKTKEWTAGEDGVFGSKVEAIADLLTFSWWPLEIPDTYKGRKHA